MSTNDNTHETAAPRTLPASRLPIVEVTVLEDRARVRRRGTLEASAVAAARGAVILDDVATTIVDRTLAGYVLSSGGGGSGGGGGGGGATRTPLGSLRVSRERLHETHALPDELATLTRAMEAARHRIAGIEASLREVDAYLASLVAIGKLAIEDTVLDASHDLGDVGVWRARLGAIDERASTARERRLALEAELADAQAEATSIDRALAAKRLVTTRERARLHLTLPPDASDAIEIEIEYVVANACWRPLHRAELTDEESSARGALVFRTDGCVWQRTGEDWPDVALVFSTERSAREASPPPLETDRLAVRRKSTTTHVAMRSEEIASTGQGMAARTAGAASQASQELPGVDDGGTAQRLRASARTTVASDGRPHRAQLGRFEAEAQLSLRAIPEVIPAILRRSLQTNAASHPLLAGPVELVRNGGFVGRTAIKLVAPGERFELGWGPEGALRLVREETTRAGDPGLLSTQRLTHVDRTLRLSNLGPSPLSLELLERIPVSELEKVKIALDPKRSHKGAAADEDGMVRLGLTLAARGTATVTLGFDVRAASDVTGLPY